VRILALSSWFPYPPDHGAKMRTHNLLKQLAQWHEITLLSFASDALAARQHIDAVQTYCQAVEIVPPPNHRSSPLRAIWQFFLTQPRSVTDTYSPLMERLVTQMLDGSKRFDIVVAFAIGPTGGTAPYVRKTRGIPRIIEDLELSMLRDQIVSQSHWLQRARLRLTWWKSRNFVVRLLRDVDGCTVTSRRERDLLASVSPGYQPLAVIPNGVDLGLYGGDFGPTEPDSLVFAGALTYKANLGAMQFFLSKVFPAVKARRPEAKLYITGSTEGVPLEELPLQDGMVLTGYLHDIRPRIAQSAVCVVPITVGGGTRLKVLEAMALGTPVVATGKGAEGLDVTDGEDILIADEPLKFADAVVRLLENPAQRAKLATNGERLVRERYGWDQIGKKLDQFLHQVARTYKHEGTV
jgi:glycosyltransferase involved in cell wall biosynthesis